MLLGRPTQVWRLSQTSCLLRLSPTCFSGVVRLIRYRHSKAVPNIASLLSPCLAASSNLAKVSESDLLRVNGFVRTVRKQKRVAFAAIGDGSSLDPLQVVMTPGQAEGLSTGTAVTVTGYWKTSPTGKKQTYELQAHQVRILGENDAVSYPLQKKYHSTDFLRTIPHLRTRLPFNSLLLQLRSQLTANLTSFFAENGYVQTHPPIITSSDCEGAGEVFTINPAAEVKTDDVELVNSQFFRTRKYLTVSSQLHLEALAQSVGKVWTLSPTFRAEKSDTPRHLSEFYMLEAELAFVEDANEIMDVVEAMLRSITEKLVKSQVGKELLQARISKSIDDEENAISGDVLKNRWQALIDSPWPRISYASAVDSLRDAVLQGNAKFKFEPSSNTGLQAEHEKYLAEHVGKNGPIFITDYPREIKPFYMAPSTSTLLPQSASTVACFDLLVPDLCEIVGGSMREHRLSSLLESMKRHGLALPTGYESNNSKVDGISKEHKPQNSTIGSQDDLGWYLDLRAYGSVPHGGFGLGFDRLLCYLSGVSNIRDVVGFPRWYGRCDC